MNTYKKQKYCYTIPCLLYAVIGHQLEILSTSLQIHNNIHLVIENQHFLDLLATYFELWFHMFLAFQLQSDC